MNNTIPQVSFREASHAQIRTLTFRLEDLITTQQAANPMLKELIVDAKGALAIHEMALNRPVGSELTPLTKSSGTKRVRATRNLLNKINTAADDFDTETSSIGISLKAICDDLGGKGIVLLKLAEQSDRIRRLLALLTVPEMMAKIEYLGIKNDLLLVEQFNNEFEMYWQQRMSEDPERALIPSMKEIRVDIDSTLGLFVKTLLWIKKKNKPGLDETTFQAIRTLMVELSSDLKSQETLALKDDLLYDPSLGHSGI